LETIKHAYKIMLKNILRTKEKHEIKKGKEKLKNEHY